MADIQNHLIDLLPQRDQRRLLARCERTDWRLGDTLCEPGDTLRSAYFPVNGFVSLIALTDDKPGVEVGMIGREGMLGIQLALGVPTASFRAVVQGSGAVLRIGADAFAVELERCDALKPMLMRYVHVSMAQLAGSSACLRFHRIGPRLARWLLMSQDRAHAERFHVTQEFLAYMLGVRRVGVTLAAGALQRNRLIRYRRGELSILDRSGLEAVACSCYAHDRLAYGAVL